MKILPQSILDFWFTEISPKQWWAKSEDFDETIRTRFGEIHQKAAKCELYEWRVTAHGRLAEIIVLDQFSRNIFRNDARAFACDNMALCLSQTAIELGCDLDLDTNEKLFLYLPFMHSESRDIHEIAVKLFNVAGLEGNYKFELLHKEIIDRFGRYPHRNAALGRVSTAEELEFLLQPNSSF